MTAKQPMKKIALDVGFDNFSTHYCEQYTVHLLWQKRIRIGKFTTFR